MLEPTRRTPVRGPTFVRLLAELADAELAPPRQALSDSLSQWIDWTHALALASALDARAADGSVDERADSEREADERSAVAGADEECAQVRATLARAIAADPAFATPEPRAGQGAGPDDRDGGFYRQRYLVLQQTMEAHIARLRARLRERLALRSGEVARLAALDAVMERALARRERSLLAAAPALLGARCERLRAQALETASIADTTEGAAAAVPATASATVSASGSWAPAFRRDMQHLLLAELDLRLQPAEGLLAALRTTADG